MVGCFFFGFFTCNLFDRNLLGGQGMEEKSDSCSRFCLYSVCHLDGAGTIAGVLTLRPFAQCAEC